MKSITLPLGVPHLKAERELIQRVLEHNFFLSARNILTSSRKATRIAGRFFGNPRMRNRSFLSLGLNRQRSVGITPLPSNPKNTTLRIKSLEGSFLLLVRRGDLRGPPQDLCGQTRPPGESDPAAPPGRPSRPQQEGGHPVVLVRLRVECHVARPELGKAQ